MLFFQFMKNSTPLLSTSCSFNNFSTKKYSLYLLIAPLFIIIGIILFLHNKEALNAYSYASIQKDYFFFINSKLSQLPNLQHNLTQLGDALIILSLMTIFIIYIPKIWEALLSASLLSLLFSRSLKEFFDIPRPATIYDNDTFSIIGKTAVGFSSFPSGHSITIFTTLTILLFAFMPKSLIKRILWIFFIIGLGLILAFTRVGVGAHHPLDVVMGSAIGYIAGVLGIIIAQKYTIWSWITNKKYYPFFILLFLICVIILIIKILNEPLIIYYISLSNLIISLYLITKIYVKEIKK